MPKKPKRSPRKEKKVYYLTYVFTAANGETTERDTGPFDYERAKSQAKEFTRLKQMSSVVIEHFSCTKRETVT